MPTPPSESGTAGVRGSLFYLGRLLIPETLKINRLEGTPAFFLFCLWSPIARFKGARFITTHRIVKQTGRASHCFRFVIGTIIKPLSDRSSNTTSLRVSEEKPPRVIRLLKLRTPLRNERFHSCYIGYTLRLILLYLVKLPVAVTWLSMLSLLVPKS